MVGTFFRVTLSFLAAFRTSAAEDAQVPLASSLRSDSYRFEWPIHKIAIIGAGAGYFLLQSKRNPAIYLNFQWAHCLSGVLSGRLRCSCI